MQAALDPLMEGKTTVVIAHRLSTVVRANQIIVLDGAISARHARQLASVPKQLLLHVRHQLLGKEGERGDRVSERGRPSAPRASRMNLQRKYGSVIFRIIHTFTWHPETVFVVRGQRQHYAP